MRLHCWTSVMRFSQQWCFDGACSSALGNLWGRTARSAVLCSGFLALFGVAKCEPALLQSCVSLAGRSSSVFMKRSMSICSSHPAGRRCCISCTCAHPDGGGGRDVASRWHVSSLGLSTDLDNNTSQHHRPCCLSSDFYRCTTSCVSYRSASHVILPRTHDCSVRTRGISRGEAACSTQPTRISYLDIPTYGRC